MEAAMGSAALRIGQLEIRPHEFVAELDGERLALTVRELELLTALAEPYRKTDRSVDVYVGKVRQKLERVNPGRELIHTHFGFGYRLSAD
jgi:DNA-binding response OmpR family regulator